jgi:hypothetical protein
MGKKDVRAKKIKSLSEKVFNVIVRRTGVIETTLEIRAGDASDARQKALETVKRRRFDGAKAIIRNEVLSVE